VKSYWNSLNERERWMVIIAAVSVFIYLYYLALYAPLSDSVALKSDQLVEKTETLAWMNKVRHQDHSSKTKQTVSNSQLLTLLATQLKDNKTLKFPYQLQQTGSGDIQLTFDAVPFTLFMKWLAKINEKYTLTLKQLDVQQTETPGVAKLMIIISGAV
jgi:general secretion pathway protein M